MIAPLIRLAMPQIDERLLEGDLPISQMSFEQLGHLEDPDIRRDWIVRLQFGNDALSCIALRGDVPRPDYPQVRPRIAELARWRNQAVVALRLVGLTQFIDPELLGDYAMADGSFRLRWPSIYRQTFLLAAQDAPEPLLSESMDRLLQVWGLLKRYEAGSRHEQIDQVLTIYRHAHFSLVVPRPTQAQLLFACLEMMAGRIVDAQANVKLAARHLHRPDAQAIDWFADHGRAVRNAVAHGYWDPKAEGPQGGEALNELAALVSTLIPPYLVAWMTRGGPDPAAVFQSSLEQGDVVDWRGMDAQVRVPRYAGLDAAAMTRQGHQYRRAGDIRTALSWFMRAGDQGDGEGAVAAGQILAKDSTQVDEARRYLMRAAELGVIQAVNLRGVLEAQSGNDDEARKWYKAAIERGDLEGVLNLGLLERRAGNTAQAKRWLGHAAKEGKAQAMRTLGLIAEDEGDRAGAEAWFQQAAEAGWPAAMNDVAVFAMERGDVDTARHWWQRAAAADNTHAASSLARLNAERREPRE
jgi:TPR repeat protein